MPHFKTVIGIVCITSCFVAQSHAASCTGTTQSACESASANCVWVSQSNVTHDSDSVTVTKPSYMCVQAQNDACYNRSQQECGNTLTKSNSRWCYWTTVDGTTGCFTSSILHR